MRSLPISLGRCIISAEILNFADSREETMKISSEMYNLSGDIKFC